MRCEYCNRSSYLNDGPTCEGCGAPLKPCGIYGDGTGTLAFIYDPRVFDGEAPFLGRPVATLPINLKRSESLGDKIAAYIAMGCVAFCGCAFLWLFIVSAIEGKL